MIPTAPWSSVLRLTDRAAIHAKTFFPPRGMHWLGTWLFPRDHLAGSSLGRYARPLVSQPIPTLLVSSGSFSMQPVLAGAILAPRFGTSGSTPGLILIVCPSGFCKTSRPSAVLPILTQPHWDARHTMAGKKTSTSPFGIRLSIRVDLKLTVLIFRS